MVWIELWDTGEDTYPTIKHGRCHDAMQCQCCNNTVPVPVPDYLCTVRLLRRVYTTICKHVALPSTRHDTTRHGSTTRLPEKWQCSVGTCNATQRNPTVETPGFYFYTSKVNFKLHVCYDIAAVASMKLRSMHPSLCA